ncbi:MAG: protein-L-isoaspartate O-methyltransferase [Pseudomonadota bacterium]
MGNFTEARIQMVDCQIRPNDVTDYNLIEAFNTIPRELFVPLGKRPIAYTDADISIYSGDTPDDERFLTQVMPFAKMLQAVGLKENDVVLCIGAGSGYGAAVISKLVASVVAIESDDSLVTEANGTLGELEIDNVAIISGDLTAGCPSEAPFDAIVIEGAVEEVPERIVSQLRNHGRLVAVVGRGLAAEIQVFSKTDDDISVTRFGNVSIPALPGFQRAETFVF